MGTGHTVFVDTHTYILVRAKESPVCPRPLNLLHRQ
ncbi:hypothetical protein CBM2592_A190016 [Cupriavidus taiwanensis]|nr:hypothetical protein CBM2592_A190016 [Cupriavidus taiwanensis]SOY83040.1 hypothetical protein CBM2591_A230018 [Cupriavidus taiwanensis]SOZ56221.1 hypothetical protein CBM2617_A200024 [Cupriavidus taiwanensis]SOZ78809.1 hypothetical protein CBM2618_A180024 [Cupriavidus taiwanensis]SOZ79083.1 hypothetical protein CBM2622_A170023 [Cupriavidus taiwanensis]